MAFVKFSFGSFEKRDTIDSGIYLLPSIAYPDKCREILGLVKLGKNLHMFIITALSQAKGFLA